jgi:single-strand DNA-binding protein
MASRSWNRVELIGNLTRDPELRYTPNGAAVCTFGIATNRTYVTEGEKKEEVDFHRLVAWNKLAELCNQLLKKGNRTFISGRLQTRSWDDQQSGQTKSITEIVVEDMILLSPKGGAEFGEESDSSPSSYTPPAPRPSTPTPPPASIVADEGGIVREPVEQPKEAAKAPKEDVDDLPF